MSVKRMSGYMIGGTMVGLALLRRIFSGIKAKHELVNEVLFFPDKEFPCSKITKNLMTPTKLACTNPTCSRLHGREGEHPSSMIKFLRYLASAQDSVDLCVYMFTQSTLAGVLCQLHEKGVRVRIITDRSEEEGINSQTEKLRDAGIKIKSNKQSNGALMHHKFVIIDKQILLSGSFNWTSNAVVNNYEAVLVTTNDNFVKPFVRKFEEMWSIFEDHPSKNGGGWFQRSGSSLFG